MKYQILKNTLDIAHAGKWLVRDSEDDFFPDALHFADIQAKLNDYLSQREHRYLQIDTISHLTDSVPKANGMIREAQWIHPTHRLLYLAILNHLLPKLDHHLPPEVYSYRRDSEDKSEYPFPNKMGRWKIFHNDFRQACLDDDTNVVLITDIASYYDHIVIDELCDRFRSILGTAASEEDIEVIALLSCLLKQWSTSGYGIPQNYDASSFFASLFLIGADKEMLEKRYRYFRWVDDIRICAKSKKQAIRALHDLQSAFLRYRMFLASDKTKIIEKGTPEFEALVDVEDDAHISELEDLVARGSRQEIETKLPFAQKRLEFHAGQNGDERKFRAFANRLMQIGEYTDFKETINAHIVPFVKDKLFEAPHKSDYWSKILQEAPPEEWLEDVDKLLRADPSVYNWQRFYLWKLLTAADTISPELLARAKSSINNPISDMEAYQAIIFIGKHGDNQDREALFVQYFLPQRSYVIQRAILLALQELPSERRSKLYKRAVTTCPDHTQLVEFLEEQDEPKYGIRLRACRQLPEQPRVLPTDIKRGIGKAQGKVMSYRLSRTDYDYE
ncbi:MAG: reverse transcriptase domain-containing protein [Chlorobiales bacterium]|nr:reverse transcriptase domain-containing protein [Chlorobiales bacterium]